MEKQLSNGSSLMDHVLFNKLDELLSHAQLYSKFMLEKMDSRRESSSCHKCTTVPNSLEEHGFESHSWQYSFIFACLYIRVVTID